MHLLPSSCTGTSRKVPQNKHFEGPQVGDAQHTGGEKGPTMAVLPAEVPSGPLCPRGILPQHHRKRTDDEWHHCPVQKLKAAPSQSSPGDTQETMCG